jgi:hypothetical protein
MAQDAFTQMALASDPTFRQRLKASMTRIARTVMAESSGTTNHAVRKAYALAFFSNPDQVVANLVGTFVFSTNVFGATTTPAFDGRGGTVVQSAVSDAAMDAQLTADWDSLSGV